MKKCAAFILAFALLLYGCARQSQKYQSTDLTLFDTVTVFTAYAESSGDFDALSARVMDELGVYHRLFDIYNEYDGMSNLASVNAAAGVSPVAVDGALLDMLEYAVGLYDLTGGRVNIAMGSVLSLWHDAREKGLDDPENAALPDSEALARAAEHCSVDSIVIDREAGTVYISDPETSIDVGAVGKGWAVEKVCAALEAEGRTGLLLSVGGNVKAVGSKADGTDWLVGVENPFGSGYLKTLSISGLAVVTSGSYQRYYTVDGVRYHHIIDPETLYPSDRYVSVTVLSKDSGLADGLSTALFNMSLEDGLALINGIDGAEAMWVTADGLESFSSGFYDFILSE